VPGKRRIPQFRSRYPWVIVERARKIRKGAGDRAAEAVAKVKPRLRGVSHEWAFFASLVAGAALIVAAGSPRARIAVGIYAMSLCALFGTSALYHRVNWTRPEIRRWMRRLDHSMIFVLIAGTYTPFAVLVLSGALADVILVVVWAGALAGSIVEMIWIEAPKWVTALIYMSLGWVGIAAFPGLLEHAGLAAVCLIGAGGLIYTAGAIVYATGRPDPDPAVFGYHEVFHVLVIAAAALHFAAVAAYALPAG
jgi:hemolysin III